MTAPLNRRSVLGSVPVLAGLTALAACSKNSGSSADPSPATSADVEVLSSDAQVRSVALADAPALGAAVTACDDLGARMLGALMAEGGNALICPVGVELSLGLLYAGAASVGTGVNALLGVGQAAADDAQATRDSTWRAIQSSLQRFDVADPAGLAGFDPKRIPDKPLLHVANRVLVVGEGTRVEQSYLDAARQWYAAGAERASAQEAQAALDQWAALHTGGLIDKSGLTVDGSTRLVLQNAVLLAARWTTEFDARDTAQGSVFHRADGSTSTADLMTRTGSFSLVAGEGWRALRLPYAEQDSRLAMDLVLPDAVASPADLPAGTWGRASAELTAAEGSGKAPEEVELQLPRLDLGSGAINLLPLLKAMGVELDQLGHISSTMDLKVDEAVQQVRLIVGETGTVAAALTEVEAVELAAPVPDETKRFVCDHPFVLRIVDLASGVAIFEAAVLDPAAG